MEAHKDLEIFIESGCQKVFIDGIKYKILGEVSPGATFVEDGKEYEIERGLTTETDLNNNIQKKYYRVICPTCKHFH